MSLLVNALMGSLSYTQTAAQGVNPSGMSNEFKQLFSETILTKNTTQPQKEPMMDKPTIDIKDKQKQSDGQVSTNKDTSESKSIEKPKEKLPSKEKSSIKQKNQDEDISIHQSEKEKKKVEDFISGEVLIEQIQEISPIIASIMEKFETTLEQVIQVLEEMGITSYELSDEKKFSEFVTKLFATEIDQLLINTKGIKDISQVFDEVSEMIQQEINLESKISGEKEFVAAFMTAQTLEKPSVSKEGIFNEVINMEIASLVTPKEVDSNRMIQNTQGSSLTDLQNMNVLKVEGIAEGGEFSNELGFSLDNRTYQTFSTVTGVKQENFLMNQKVNFADQIIEKMQLTALQEGKELSIELSPKELGRLSLKLTEQQGVITASIKVDSEKTKELLLQNIQGLKQNLEEQGLQVGSFDVDVRDHSSHFEMEKQKQKSSKRIEELINKHLIEEDLEEVEKQSKEPLMETTVDYMA